MTRIRVPSPDLAASWWLVRIIWACDFSDTVHTASVCGVSISLSVDRRLSAIKLERWAAWYYHDL